MIAQRPRVGLSKQWRMRNNKSIMNGLRHKNTREQDEDTNLRNPLLQNEHVGVDEKIMYSVPNCKEVAQISLSQFHHRANTCLRDRQGQKEDAMSTRSKKRLSLILICLIFCPM